MENTPRLYHTLVYVFSQHQNGGKPPEGQTSVRAH